MRETVKLYVHHQHETIYVPVPLCTYLLQWYHLTLQNPGMKRMQATLKENFYWPGVPLPTNSKLTPWEEVHVDLIGPWDV